MNEAQARNEIVEYGRSIYNRGLTGGSTGNISVRIGTQFLATPTGSSLGNLDPERLSLLDSNGDLVSGDRPTKEALFHLAMYAERPDANAIVHIHSTHAVAVSCLKELDPEDALPPITAYYVMRVGKLPLVPFHPPGSQSLVDAVRQSSPDHHSLLLAHHGPIVAGPNLATAVDAIEELEQTARLFLLLRSEDHNVLSEAQVRDITGG